MKKICAVIAARGDSKRVKNKNIRPFGNSNLLQRKLAQLKEILHEDEIYVNSDSEKIINIAKKERVNTIKRLKKYASSNVKINDVYVNVVEKVPSKHILFIHITSPFIKTTTIKNCIKRYFNLPKRFDSLATVTSFKKFLWFKDKSINYKPAKMQGSQNLPNYYYLNFAINLLPKKLIIKQKNIIGKKFYPFFLNEFESFDIDTLEEFKRAEKMIESS